MRPVHLTEYMPHYTTVDIRYSGADKVTVDIRYSGADKVYIGFRPIAECKMSSGSNVMGDRYKGL